MRTSRIRHSLLGALSLLVASQAVAADQPDTTPDITRHDISFLPPTNPLLLQFGMKVEALETPAAGPADAHTVTRDVMTGENGHLVTFEFEEGQTRQILREKKVTLMTIEGVGGVLFGRHKHAKNKDLSDQPKPAIEGSSFTGVLIDIPL